MGRVVDKSQNDQAWERYDVYKNWFIERILRPEETRAIVVLPIEELEPRYRDKPPEQLTEAPKGVSVLYLSPALGAPELVVPGKQANYDRDILLTSAAGQIPFNSRITGQQEYLPVAVSLLGAPGTDLELIEMTEDFLKHAKRSTNVLTGRTMFRGNDKQLPRGL